MNLRLRVSQSLAAAGALLIVEFPSRRFLERLVQAIEPSSTTDETRPGEE